jgi:hypothetical protein
MADNYVELPQLCSYAFASNHDYKCCSPLTYVSTACEISKRLVSQIMGLFFLSNLVPSNMIHVYQQKTTIKVCIPTNEHDNSKDI